jgi:hypothetical protein
METIAVYWEPKIKTYGMIEKTGLSLVSMTLPLSDTLKVMQNLRSQADLAEGLLMISAAPNAEGQMKTHLVLDSPKNIPHQEVIADWLIGNDVNVSPRLMPAVEMVYFHGPHYGDRYGIASMVFSALIANRISLLHSVCSAASIYLVMPEGQAEAARRALSDKVVVPKAEARN